MLPGLRPVVRAIASDRLALFGVAVILIFVILAVFAPVIAPHDPNEILVGDNGLTAKYQPPSALYPFGTNNLGRDIFSQVVYGSQVALLVGFLSALSVTIIGANVGLVAGYFGGRIDDALMRLVDVCYSIPFEPFAILLVGVLGPSVFNLVLVMTLIMWRGPAREIRAQVLSLSQRPFVKAARVAGASNFRILYVHIAPNVLPLMLLYIPITVGWAIIAEASLSFLGFGAPQTVSWGVILQTAFTSGAMRQAWWWMFAPGIAIVLVVISIFFITRALEPIANPHLRE